MASTVEELANLWPDESWSIGQTRGYRQKYRATVHGHGTCAMGEGITAREAMDAAIASFREEFPDRITAKLQQLARAKADLARLEAELGEEA